MLIEIPFYINFHINKITLLETSFEKQLGVRTFPEYSFKRFSNYILHSSFHGCFCFKS